VGGTLQQRILTEYQLTEDNIAAAAFLTMGTLNPVATETFVIADTFGTETYTFVAARSVAFEVTIGGSPAVTLANLVTAIQTDSARYNAITPTTKLTRLRSGGQAGTVVYQKTSIGPYSPRMYCSSGTSGRRLRSYDFSYRFDYSSANGGTVTTLDTSDPEVQKWFGFFTSGNPEQNQQGDLRFAILEGRVYQYHSEAPTTGTVWRLLTGSTRRAVTTEATVTETDLSGSGGTITCDTTSAAFIVHLPSAATIVAGSRITIKKTVTSANEVTIEPDSADTVDGSAGATLMSVLTGKAANTRYCITLECDGVSNWSILSSF
jgi:hypothetical protein